MGILAEIVTAADARQLKFLLIGGHAVAAHGYVRTTADADFLTSKEDRMEWRSLMENFGYTVLFDGGNFLQFEPPPGGAWPVDIMFVPEPTFVAMYQARQPTELDETEIQIPSVEHLMALKLHAIKHARTKRVLKDMDDLIGLTKSRGIEMRSEMFRLLCQKYGSEEIYARLLRTEGP